MPFKTTGRNQKKLSIHNQGVYVCLNCGTGRNQKKLSIHNYGVVGKLGGGTGRNQKKLSIHNCVVSIVTHQ